jgi:hypothetical protein
MLKGTTFADYCKGDSIYAAWAPGIAPFDDSYGKKPPKFPAASP